MDDLEMMLISMSVFMFQMFQDHNWNLLFASFKRINSRQKWVKVQNFYEITVPQMVPRVYRRYFRLDKETVAALVNYIPMTEELEKLRTPVEKCVAMTLAFLGSKCTSLVLAHLFDMSEEAYLRITELVMDAMLENIHQIIYWPSKAELPFYAREFNKMPGFFPNTIGAIDGLHLEIEITEERTERDNYLNYKQWFSVHLQGTCTYDLRFIDVFAGWPGRSHDGRVFRESPLFKQMTNLMNDGKRRLVDTFHILGDSAYPVMPHLMTPYKHTRGIRHLNRDRKLFNKNFSSKRQIIERAFGLLVRRFPRLYKLNQRSLKKKVKIILTACMIHNICITEKDNIDYFFQKAQQRPIRRRHLRTPRNPPQILFHGRGVLKKNLLKDALWQFLTR